jgi:peptidylprolyl isomerase
MSLAKIGDTVKVHYTGRLENGKEFDTSKDREPLEFTIGNGSMMPGFEKGIIGMEAGDKKTFTVLPEEAYGPRHEELIATIDKSEFPKDITPRIGLNLQIMQPDGRIMNLTVADMDEDTVTLDANHPLAGKTLIFDVELVDIL